MKTRKKQNESYTAARVACLIFLDITYNFISGYIEKQNAINDINYLNVNCILVGEIENKTLTLMCNVRKEPRSLLKGDKMTHISMCSRTVRFYLSTNEINYYCYVMWRP